MIQSNPVSKLTKPILQRCIRILESCVTRISVIRRSGLLLLILLFQSFINASAQEPNYAVHANIIYHFTKYINWPPQARKGDFVIGIVGDSPLFDELKLSTANKTASGQKIIIRHYSSSSQTFDCNILFISSEESSRLKKIAVATASRSVLIVSEGKGLATKGASINFKIAEERLRLEINKNNIENKGLGIATELLQLGTVVE